MKIELIFKDIVDDIEDVVANIRVEDSSEADAPAQQLFSTKTEPFTIRRSQPTVIVDVNFILPSQKHELSLFIRVETLNKSKENIKFLNTTTTFLSGDPNVLTRVSLERIT